ncbi:MAG: aspartate ammonia-lyase [Castellaniella sp.]|uniref:aspartate ammonia-lyase n=1 Tax=Castellaniella sp. TaxID=1955812 RepID=UPI0011F8C2C7|nr:aspartate ammonia-lyase [Castellaniella sp.]TAN28092.1 MAG: aspartate ammonia-lyase [Castellaniella sp.]
MQSTSVTGTRNVDAHLTDDRSSHVYYGQETAKAIANFHISDTRLEQFPVLIKALAYVKLSAARTNAKLDLLERTKAQAIYKVCKEIIAGQHGSEFPLDVYQGGAGTSTNMNMNEVIANRGLEILGFERGQYDKLHPNNDVNLSQSTNDVYPTAVRLAILLAMQPLVDALNQLANSFEERSEDFADIVKLGRTQLQDAVPMTMGQEFLGFAVAVRDSINALGEAGMACHRVNLGGTAIGTGINATEEYQSAVVAELREATGIAFATSDNLIQACWDTDAFLAASSALKRTATRLSKISSDLRLLSSGPRGGLGEINLPPLQAGSSIMPGKINPVIPEVVNQVAFQIIGNDLTVTLAAESGQLQLNVMEPVMAFNVLNSIQLLTNAATALNEKCVSGITANALACMAHLENSMAGATALTPVIGYGRAAVLAKEALASGKTLRDVLNNQADVPREAVERALDMKELTRPVRLDS